MRFVLIGFFSFLYLLVQREHLLWNWDELQYLINIFKGERSSLILGRSGFIFPLHALWKLQNLTFPSLQFESFRHFISLWSCGFTALFVTCSTALLDRIFKSFWISLVFAILILGHYGTIRIADSAEPDAMMYGLVALSLWLFAKAQDEKRKIYLLSSALIFGFAFTVREPTLFFAIFFLPFFRPVFPLKDYVSALVLAFLVAVAPFVYFAITDTQSYLHDIFSSNSHSNLYEYQSFLERMVFVLKQHFFRPLWLMIPISVGAIVAHLFPKSIDLRRQGHWLALLCWIPCLLTLFITNQGVTNDPRYFCTLTLLWAFYLVCALMLCRKFLRNDMALALAAVLLILFHRIDTKDDFEGWRQADQKSRSQFAKVEPFLSEKSLLLVGIHGPYFIYQGLNQGLIFKVLSAGWNWPGDQLFEVLSKALKEGQDVLYASDADWRPHNQSQLQGLPQEFKMDPLAEGLYRLKK